MSSTDQTLSNQSLLDDALLGEALKKWKTYIHGETIEELQDVIMCSPIKGKTCSVCGIPSTITWLYRHKDEVDDTYFVACDLYKKWKQQKGPCIDEYEPMLKAILAAFFVILLC